MPLHVGVMLEGKGRRMAVSVEQRVMNILSEVTGSAAVVTDPDVALFRTGLLDSLATAELLVALSEAFRVEFSPAEFEPDAWATPRLVIARVEERLRA